MRLPNLIIAGAPKAGSSSLFFWLAAHPEVYGSPRKETFYFIDEDSPLLCPEANYNLHGLEKYESFFPDCPDEAKIVLEATPHYVYQQTALDFFANCDPQPHVVCLLRKPSKRIFSSFSFVQNNLALIDNELTFDRVTDLLLDETGELIKELNYSPDAPIYKWLEVQLSKGRYYEYLIPWVQRFPREKIHIILFEEMIADPRKTLIKLAKDIGIDSNFYQDFYFEQRTQTIAIKNRFAHQLLLKLALFFIDNQIFGTSKIRGLLKSIYFKFNTSKPQKAKSTSLERLDDYFKPYNQKLAESLNLNIDVWN